MSRENFPVAIFLLGAMVVAVPMGMAALYVARSDRHDYEAGWAEGWRAHLAQVDEQKDNLSALGLCAYSELVCKGASARSPVK